MKHFTTLAAASALAVAALVASTPAAAVITTFAGYNQVNGSAKLLRYARVGGGAGTGNAIHSTTMGTSTALGATAVNFFYTIPAPPALTGNLAAFMTVNATTTSTVAASGTNRQQGGFNGFIKFIKATPVGGLNNLLTVNFTNATFTTRQGATAGSFFGSDPSTSFVVTSDFLTFAPGTVFDFSVAITAFAPTFSAANNTYGRTIRGTSTGSFASDPSPSLVPEPETWAMFILGFGMVGAAVRRRARTTRVAA